MAKSPYAKGFETLDNEVHARKLPVRGELPDWLSGTLFRTGPARFEIGDRSLAHWFDGYAMLHAFSFMGGEVTYTNRYLKSRAYTEAREAGELVRGEFATDPCRSIFERVAALFDPDEPTDNANVNISRIADEPVALTETTMPVRFDPESLETLGHSPYEELTGDSISGALTTAHPHFDPGRGDFYNYVIDFGRKSTYSIFATDSSTGSRRLLTEIEVDRPAYMHSFGMTENLLVLTEFPFVVNPLMLQLRDIPFIENYEWEPERGTRVHLIDKDSGEVLRVAEAPALFAFHHVNAYEEGDTVLCDLVAYEDSRIIDRLYLDRLRGEDPVVATGRLTRLRIGPDGPATRETLFDQRFELPRIDYSRSAGREHRVVYGVGVEGEGPGDFIDNLLKFDLDSGRCDTWYEEGAYPGEPVFVAAPEGDDAVILSVVLDAARDSSFLLVLDAESWEEVARAETPHHIPFGFHGNYFGDEPAETIHS